ncbi:hypothetical protein PVL29_015659 [Vitis rotundifolia]|uniref:Leucine-rich repeat-containing N-terminal plant-type domain-containing protein n=1 Tax=Vitis rotundifolia TaxID=103349 RepID=A0AA39DKH7_VITRO|nr:hypothetical protein PVL29_015659 [Vitis rotundifolia]
MRFLALLSSFHLIVTNSSSSMQQPLCHDNESSALLQFKQSFLIDEYASEDSYAYPKVATWKSHGEGSDCCSWDGVECDRETGHVIGLYLASSCLYGSINSSSTLFNLVHLRRLDLSDNHFNYSEIPFGVGQLSRLRSLNLSYSRFSGQIPSELLVLSELVFLDLWGNPMLQLQKPGLRELVQNLTHLKTLHLSYVNISSTIPHALANLSSLTSLFLRECGLHGEFPMTIFRLPRLQNLSVRYNPDLIGYLPEFQENSPLKMLYLGGTSFSGELPASIGRLGSLTEFDISSCNFTGLVPSPLGHIPQLSRLDLSNNSFSGQIPSFMANLTQLTYLDLSLNDFSVGTLAWLGKQTKLTYLDLRQINLIGKIPFSLVNMSQLTLLTLAKNQLSGQIPSWLMNLTQLTALDLGGNNLEGGIPSSLFELVNLQDLSVQGNNLTGIVELHMLSKLKNLTELQLSGNRLSLLSYTRTNATLPKFKFLGLESCNLTEFPDFLQNQDELEVLSLSDNKIHGPIPQWMWNISKETLRALVLSRNFLTGFDQRPVVLPWSRLYHLQLDSNMLQGSLPIPPPSTLVYKVSGNKLTGEIPPLICNMTSLMLLDLSSNNLSGRIPQCLANFSKSLSVLDLGSNSLDGPIPQTCTMSNNLRVIDLGENQFQGQIPRSLASCTKLENLVLGNNQINDIFPFWLGALPQLQVLILASNRFHGTIGRWHTNFRFPKLRIIDLSDNEFIGDLPSEYFQNWDAMKLKDIANGLRYMQTRPTFEFQGYTWISDYMYSVTMTNKGMRRFYENIPDIFMAIDFSGNNFKGQIPTSIGSLMGLHLLNLGGNNLTGQIPSSMGNLIQLESLDLSQNKLSGEIPWQLTRMTFLEFFNVSHNRLTGRILQGKQFATFENASFDGNPGLCGSPLSRECESSEASPPTRSSSKQGSTSEFDWKIILMGYGSGLLIGVSIGYCLTSWKHEWFVKTFEKRQRKWTGKERKGHRG